MKHYQIIRLGPREQAMLVGLREWLREDLLVELTLFDGRKFVGWIYTRDRLQCVLGEKYVPFGPEEIRAVRSLAEDETFIRTHDHDSILKQIRERAQDPELRMILLSLTTGKLDTSYPVGCMLKRLTETRPSPE